MTALAAWLAALALAPQEPAPPLVPALPEGWTRERLEFPLEFAPAIALEGHEELAFAPGMFEAGAADFWSYALALEVTGPGGAALAVDAGWLEGFLEEYYRGLCARVGEARGLELDLERVDAVVSGGGAGFTAAVELVDPFVTAEPLSLALEVLVHPDPGGGNRLQVLGLASPAPADAAVWTELRALGAAWRAARPVPVLLNHVYMVPDLATYEALRDSEFLRELAVVEERTTRRGDMTYTGLYLYGEHTYFEFLRPDPAIGFAPGGTGVAFGVEVPGGLARVAAALEAAGVQTFAAPISRELDGEQVPWFDMLGIQAATATQRLQLFAMEYDPRFLERWHPRAGEPAGRLDRAGVLARYAEVLGGPEEPLLRDVDRVQLELAPEEHARCDEVTAALGLGIAAGIGRVAGQDYDPDAWSLYAAGAGFELKADRARASPGGVRLFQGHLRRPVEARDLDFGQVRLHIGDGRFTLRFEGLPAEETK